MIGAGVVTGILAGMFGIGGGVLLIPILVLIFKFPQQTASGTSLVALLLPVGILGVWEYFKAGKIGPDHLKYGAWIALGLFVGIYLGARLSVGLSTETMRKSFAVFLAMLAVRMWLQSPA